MVHQWLTTSSSRSASGPTTRRSAASNGARRRRDRPRDAARLAACGARFIPARAGNTFGLRCCACSRPVHPRSRGEHGGGINGACYRFGSSPLARGTPAHEPGDDARCRFIPARAGNTSRAARGCAAVHPRSRGEHERAAVIGSMQRGSSPLARGTPPGPAPEARDAGSSPLARGTRASAGLTGPPRAVHPRSRGEHIDLPRAGQRFRLARGTLVDVAGSSPLARGTRAMRPGLVAVHPRSRGEHPSMRSRRFIRAGDPAVHPRSRGEHSSRQRERSGPARTLASVHPRSRGEHSLVERLYPGSSPLARGTLLRETAAGYLHRFIPARAGNTKPSRHRGQRPHGPGSSPLARGTHRPLCRWRETPVHPRSRGEHQPERYAASDHTYGSSPLARGTPRYPRCGSRLHERFIPARAGNTRARGRPSRHPAPVHPRSRGEHRSVPRINPALDRFIPARAGNTAADGHPRGRSTVHPRSRGEHDDNSALAQRRAVHPRSRGEHVWRTIQRAARRGSSPLARGTRSSIADLQCEGRFIPARAGNTAQGTPCWLEHAVHPRSRGEHRSTKKFPRPKYGSSPLARGTPDEQLDVVRVMRFIPARAGNTHFIPPRVRSYPVHPRSRGEHMRSALAASVWSGSSPLARGTQAGPDPRVQQLRFIPARAGNTPCTWTT